MSDRRQRATPLLTTPVVVLALGLIFAFSIASVAFAPEDSEVAAWWPAAGLGSGLLALSGSRAWLKLVPALVLVTAAANVVSGRDVGVALLFGVANTAENLVVALALGAHLARPWLRTREDIGRLVVAGALGALTAGLLAGTVVQVLRGADLLTAALEVAASHGASEVLVLPVVLLLTDPQASRPTSANRLVRVLHVAVTISSFVVVHSMSQTLPIAFAPFVFLVATAQVVSLRSLAWTSTVGGFIVTLLTARGGGPFAATDLAPATVGALVQVDLVVIALVSLPLGVAVAQAASSRRALEQDRESLRTALSREREVVERLEELDRAKSEFLSTVSHELRTPLTSIVGYTEILAHQTVGPVTEEQARVLRRIDRGAHRLVGLIENVLVISRVEAVGTRRLSRTVDVVEVVRRAVVGADHLLFDRSLRVQLQVEPGPIEVIGDDEGLERAVLNLVTNAIKFTGDDGRIDVSVRIGTAGADGGEPQAVIEVEDTGIGISVADQPQLFQRFFRAETALSAALPGTGLGLSIVRVVVEEHDGTVDVESAPGVGTRVRISLPLAVKPGV